MTDKKHKVLIVCSANKSRSPAFAAYLKHFMKDMGFDVHSAGTHTGVINELGKEGKTGANSIIRNILNEEGISEINFHEMKPVSRKIATESDIILTVSEGNKRKILTGYPETRGKVFVIKEFLGLSGNPNIKDAHYHGAMDEKMYDGVTEKDTEGAYRKMLKEIRELSLSIADKLTGHSQTAG